MKNINNDVISLNFPEYQAVNDVTLPHVKNNRKTPTKNMPAIHTSQ